MRQLPQLQKLYEKYRGRGLHMFHVESQHHSFENVQAFLKLRGVSFPNPILDWCDFPLIGGNAAFNWGYNPAKLPKTYIIGVDGRVIWEGRFGYDEVLEKELKKVRYPGLFKRTVEPALRPAAKLFAKGRYADAQAEAEKQLERTEQERQRADAEWIIRRVGEILARWQQQIAEAREARRFADALALLEKLADRFEGSAPGKAARRKAQELSKDADVKREIEASEALDELFRRQGSKGGKARAELAKRLRKFAQERAGLWAADQALLLAEGLE